MSPEPVSLDELHQRLHAEAALISVDVPAAFRRVVPPHTSSRRAHRRRIRMALVAVAAAIAGIIVAGTTLGHHGSGPRQRLSVPGGSISAPARVVVVGTDGTVSTVSSADGGDSRMISVEGLPQGAGGVVSVAVRTDGRALYAGIGLIPIGRQCGGLIKTVPLDGTAPSSAPPATGSLPAVSPDGTRLASVGKCQFVVVTDLATGATVGLWSPPRDPAGADPGPFVTHLSWSADGRLAVTLQHDRTEDVAVVTFGAASDGSDTTFAMVTPTAAPGQRPVAGVASASLSDATWLGSTGKLAVLSTGCPTPAPCPTPGSSILSVDPATGAAVTLADLGTRTVIGIDADVTGEHIVYLVSGTNDVEELTGGHVRPIAHLTSPASSVVWAPDPSGPPRVDPTPPTTAPPTAPPPLSMGGGVLAGNAIYALGNPAGSAVPPPVTVVRLSVPDGAITARSAPLRGATALDVDDQGVWVAGGYQTQSVEPDNRLLYRLDRVSLAETARLELPSPPISVVTAAGSVWVGTEAGGVYRVDPGTARVVSQFATGAEVISIAVDPTGRALYLSENGLVAGSRITRRDLNGRVVASFDLHGAGPGRLAVAADGIWSSYPTGMMNSMVHLVGPNLRIGPTWDGQTHDGQPWPAQRFEVQVATGMVWVTGSMGPGAIECIDPATGVAKGGIGFDQTGTDYVAADRVYQLAPSGALQSAPMPAACHP